jgi:uncharacterized protein YceH (UPF0502 family)
MHLFSGNSIEFFSSEPAAQEIPAQERINRLEEETARLKSELDELKQAFAEFKAQF